MLAKQFCATAMIPYESNFFKYFAMNFNALGLKKLVTTCYATSPVVGDEFEYYVDNAGQLAFVPDTDTTPLVCSTRRPYRVEITEVTDENHDGGQILRMSNILCETEKIL